MSSLSERAARETICEIGRRLHQKGWLAAADGNISLRLASNNILITPSGAHKGYLSPDEISRITIDNRVLEGRPSGERLMHLAVYKNAPKAVAVVHAHPPVATAWTVAHPHLKELPNECLSEVILAAGRIPFAAYAQPGTDQMGEALLPFLPECRLIVLSRHGALTWGESLVEAYNGMERLEHAAVTLAHAMALGGTTSLPSEEVARLVAMRARSDGRTL